jgi:hypothetical protein
VRRGMGWSVAAVVAVGLLVGWFAATRDRTPPAPFRVEELRARVELATGSRQQVQSALDGWTARKRELVADGGADTAHAAIRLTWDVPPGVRPDHIIALVVIDKRDNRRVLFVGWDRPAARVSDHDPAISNGSEGRDRRVAERYPWLSAMRPQSVDVGGRSQGSNLSFQARAGAPIVALVQLPTGAGPIEPGADDLLVALVLRDGDHVHWATRLAG